MSNLKKVISVTGNGSFQSQYGDANGLMYSFIYTLENDRGETGEFHVNHKTNEPKFKAGDEVELETKGQDKYGNQKAKLHKPGQNQGGYSGGGQRGAQRETQKARLASFALSYAKDQVGYLDIDKSELGSIAESTCLIADVYLEWLEKNSND